MKTTAKNTSTEDSESYASKISGSILRTLGMEDEPERDPTGEDVLNKAKDTAETAQKAIVAGGKEVMRKSQDTANRMKDAGDSAVEKMKTTARHAEDNINEAAKRASDKTWTAAHDAAETAGDAMTTAGDSMRTTAERIAPEAATPEPKGILRSVSDHFKHDVVEPITNLAHSVQDKFSHTSEENAAPAEIRNKADFAGADDTLKKRALDVTGDGRAAKRLNTE